MSSVEQKIREEIQQTLLKHTKTNFTKQLADIIDEATQALLQIIESDVIHKEYALYFSSDIPSFTDIQDYSDHVIAIRNRLRAEQRANLREDK